MKALSIFVLVAVLAGLPLVADAQQRAQRGSDVLVDINSIVGAKVRDRQGKDMGKVDRLLIDGKDGKIDAAVVATGGFLGVGRERVRVPWDKLQVQRDNGSIVVTADRQVLEQAQAVRDDTSSPAASPSR